MSIIKMKKEQFHCTDHVPQSVTVSLLAVCGSVGILTVVGVGVFCAKVRLHRHWSFHPFDRDECSGEDMDFDVFLSCSLDDRVTYGRRMADLVQSKGYRVFSPGAYTTEETTAAIQHSRRAVFLLTKHFVKSEYCLQEFQTALEHNSKRDKRIVILMMLDNPLQLYTNNAREAVALRKYIAKHRRRCVDVNDDKNWPDKLLYALPIRPLPASAAEGVPDAGDDVQLINT